MTRSPRALVPALALTFMAALLGGSATAGAAQPTRWTADPAHSSATFTVVHLVITKVSGTLPIKSATIVTGSAPNVPQSVEAVLDPAGVNTQQPKRDADLRSDEFFDVAQYPTITFASTSITPGQNGDFTIAGNLTMHGVTRPVTLNAHYNGATTGPRGEPRIGYSATTTIDRADYNIKFDKTAPGGALIVGPQVAIDIEIEAVSAPKS